MGNVLDFNKIKKQYLTVKLRDAEQTTLLVCTPSKKLFAEIIETGSALVEIDSANLSSEDAETVLVNSYLICAKALSNNKTMHKISAEELAAIFDFEDLLIFFNAYVDFVNGIATEKN